MTSASLKSQIDGFDVELARDAQTSVVPNILLRLRLIPRHHGLRRRFGWTFLLWCVFVWRNFWLDRLLFNVRGRGLYFGFISLGLLTHSRGSIGKGPTHFQRGASSFLLAAHDYFVRLRAASLTLPAAL